MAPSAIAKRRVVHAALLAGIIALGVASRSAPVGAFAYDKSLGDVLYAMAAYLAIALLLPRLPVKAVAALAAVACFVVEFLQLTGFNQSLLRVPVLRWFLGTTFLWHDLGCYLVGVAVAGCLDSFWVRRGRG